MKNVDALFKGCYPPVHFQALGKSFGRSSRIAKEWLQYGIGTTHPTQKNSPLLGGLFKSATAIVSGGRVLDVANLAGTCRGYFQGAVRAFLLEVSSTKLPAGIRLRTESAACTPNGWSRSGASTPSRRTRSFRPLTSSSYVSASMTRTTRTLSVKRGALFADPMRQAKGKSIYRRIFIAQICKILS